MLSSSGCEWDLNLLRSGSGARGSGSELMGGRLGTLRRAPWLVLALVLVGSMGVAQGTAISPWCINPGARGTSPEQTRGGPAQCGVSESSRGASGVSLSLLC